MMKSTSQWKRRLAEDWLTGASVASKASGQVVPPAHRLARAGCAMSGTGAVCSKTFSALTHHSTRSGYQRMA